jgi:hypothetical protein
MGRKGQLRSWGTDGQKKDLLFIVSFIVRRAYSQRVLPLGLAANKGQSSSFFGLVIFFFIDLLV